jgi:hypothetical protein
MPEKLQPLPKTTCLPNPGIFYSTRGGKSQKLIVSEMILEKWK